MRDNTTMQYVDTLINTVKIELRGEISKIKNGGSGGIGNAIGGDEPANQETADIFKRITRMERILQNFEKQVAE